MEGRDTAPANAFVDTVAAIVTPAGEGGLAVVRVSGPRSLALAEALFHPVGGPSALESHRARFGLVVSGEGEPLDEAVLLPMHGPRSYTGEDSVEFQCHGGLVPARRVLAACIATGARPAAPGEFTRRAFLNGRLSLDQAEAVADLIHAQDELSASAALAQLRGGLRDEISRLEAPLRELLVDLEGDLEFAQEQAEPSVSPARLAGVIEDARAAAERLLARAPAARRVREGVNVVIAGAPNSGKSSLFNALLGRSRALVDADAGTTRDVITEPLRHGGLTFVLHDTAGLRAGGERVEALGMARARTSVAEADIVIWTNDLSTREPAGDESLRLDVRGTPLLVGTKADLGGARVAAGIGEGPLDLVTSATTGEGIAALRDALVGAADAGGMRAVAQQGLYLNARHQSRLMEARDGLAALHEAIQLGRAGEEVVATLLGGLLAGIGEISGRVFTEALLGEVFSRFCVGK